MDPVTFNITTRTPMQLRAALVIAAACASLAYAAGINAQITAPAGPQSQDNRTAPMAAQTDSATPTVHESHEPQAKEAKGKSRGPSANKAHKPEGAGGFNNGLEGTGTGSNK